MRQFGQDDMPVRACSMHPSQKTCSQGVTIAGLRGMPKQIEHINSEGTSSERRGGADPASREGLMPKNQ